MSDNRTIVVEGGENFGEQLLRMARSGAREVEVMTQREFDNYVAEDVSSHFNEETKRFDF